MQNYGLTEPDKMTTYWKKGPPTTINGKSVVLIFRYATALVFFRVLFSIGRKRS